MKNLGGFIMVTKRDKKILIWIEEYKSITINQCAKIFFTTNKYAYDQARKRLRYLNKERLIRRYRKDPKSEAVYYIDKKLKVHDLKIFDVVAEFVACGWKIIAFSKEEVITGNNKKYVVDALCVFSKGDMILPIFLEIDYSHMTGLEKINDVINIFVNRESTKTKMFFVVRISQEKIAFRDTINPHVQLVYIPWDLAGLKKVLC